MIIMHFGTGLNFCSDNIHVCRKVSIVIYTLFLPWHVGSQALQIEVGDRSRGQTLFYAST